MSQQGLRFMLDVNGVVEKQNGSCALLRKKDSPLRVNLYGEPRPMEKKAT
jgi:hypothetical protein